MFLVVLAIAIFAWNYYLQLRDYVSTDYAYIDADRVSVSPKILGTISADCRRRRLREEGQTLVRLDDSDLRAQEAQAKASLAFAHENVLLAKVNLEKPRPIISARSTQIPLKKIPKEQYHHGRE